MALVDASVWPSYADFCFFLRRGVDREGASVRRV